MRAVTQFARARGAIAASFEAPESKKSLLRLARRLVRSLESEGMPWTSVLASMAHASLANAEADRETAVHHLRAAVERADAASMTLHAASARFQLSRLLEAAEGRVLREAADEAMRAKSVRSPERFAGMLLPGRWQA
jgi:hypothetical protein